MKAGWILLLLLLFTLVASPTLAGPEEDRKAYQNYYKDRFPDVPFQDFVNGLYALDANLRGQWQDIEEFPPYTIAVEEGEELINKPFKNGKTIAGCFPEKGVGIANRYPYFDVEQNKVITLALAVVECMKANGEKPYGYSKGKLASVLAYMAFTTRDKEIKTEDPSKHPNALKAYEAGKRFYYARRGQLNMACAHCHVDHAGKMLRGNRLGPGLGQVSHFPVYRSKWGGLGTLHRRFGGCNKQIRAAPYSAQSEEYRNLEYFMTYMSNGLRWNGPGVRF